MAERLCSGLQNRGHRFNSGTDLQILLYKTRSFKIVYQNNFNNNRNNSGNYNKSNNFRRNNNGPRIGKFITSPEVRLIDENENNVGIVPTKQAIEMAFNAGLDLIEIVPNANPPVAKIMDYGKWKYEESKKKSAIKKKQKTIEIKELKYSSNIEENDYQVKLRNGKKFISEGNKVKISLRFRGREIGYPDTFRSRAGEYVGRRFRRRRRSRNSDTERHAREREICDALKQ